MNILICVAYLIVPVLVFWRPRLGFAFVPISFLLSGCQEIAHESTASAVVPLLYGASFAWMTFATHCRAVRVVSKDGTASQGEEAV